MTAVIPLADLARRLPIVGKLRHGVFDGRRPKAIDTWRLTTSSRPFADQFALTYGGTVEPMTNKNSQHQWEVVSEATEIAIGLIGGEHGYDIDYELWSAGGCQRRCDGVTCHVLQTTGPDDVEYVPNPCICDAKGELECSLKSRLTLILPDLLFAGGVVYETGSKNFAEESQGMLALLAQMGGGTTRGILRLEQRRSSGNRRYTMAVVGVEQSPEAIMSGQASMAALGKSALPQEPSPALGAGEGGAVSHPSSPSTSPQGDASESDATGEGASDSEEDIVDAEIVDEPSDEEVAKQRRRFMALVGECGLSYDDEVKPWLVAKYGWSWSDMLHEDRDKLVKALAREDKRPAFVAAVRGAS